MILLRFSIEARSRFCSLSLNVCHTEGKGEGMRWRTCTPARERQRNSQKKKTPCSSLTCRVTRVTPLFRNGMWSSWIGLTVRSGQKYSTLVAWSESWFMECKRFSNWENKRNMQVLFEWINQKFNTVFGYGCWQEKKIIRLVFLLLIHAFATNGSRNEAHCHHKRVWIQSWVIFHLQAHAQFTHHHF